MESWHYLLSGIILVLVINLIASRAVRYHHDSPLLNLLFYTKFGPRTDMKYMTRGDLLWSAWMFLVYGAIFIVIFMGILLIFARRGIKGASVVVWAALTVVLLSFVVCAIATLCLLVTAIFRKQDYVPPPEEDEEKTV